MRLPIMDTRKLLEELENVINNASEVPFTNKKWWIRTRWKG